MRSRPRFTLASLVLLCVVFVSNSPHSASAEKQANKTPIVVVPGILGSKLRSNTKQLWGYGAYSSLTRFRDLSNKPKDTIRPDGIVEQFAFLGPIGVEAYGGFLSYLKDQLNYKAGKDLHVFAYDWRKSSAENSRKLGVFINGIAPGTDEKVDLVAHSMGGIVSRLALLNHLAPGKVRNFIELGVPLKGSGAALETLKSGWGTAVNTLAGGEETVRRTILSFDSIFELMPSYKGCCFVEMDDGKLEAIDLFSEQGIKALMESLDLKSKMVRNSFAKNMSEAQAVRARLRAPIKDLVERHSVFAGRGRKTVKSVLVGKGKPIRFLDTMTDGDGTVYLRSSNPGLNIAFPSLEPHQTLFSDRGFRILLREHIINKSETFLPLSERFRGFDLKSEAASDNRLQKSKPASVIGVGLDDCPTLITSYMETTCTVRVQFRPLRAKLPSPQIQISDTAGRTRTAEKKCNFSTNTATCRIVFSSGPPGSHRIVLSFSEFEGEVLAGSIYSITDKK